MAPPTTKPRLHWAEFLLLVLALVLVDIALGWKKPHTFLDFDRLYFGKALFALFIYVVVRWASEDPGNPHPNSANLYGK